MRGQGQLPDGARLDRLTGRGRAGFHRLHLRLHFNLFLHRQRAQLRRHACGFCNTHRNIGKTGLGETGALDSDRIICNRQQGRSERTVGVGLGGACQSSHVLVHDADIRPRHHRAARIQHRARDRAGCASLGQRPSTADESH